MALGGCMKNTFYVMSVVFFGVLVLCISQAFCQDQQEGHALELAGIADADRVELVPEISFEFPPQPSRVIDDSAQIKNIIIILNKAVSRQPCDCLPKYALNFYKKGVLLTVISFGPEDGFLRYGGYDYTLSRELLSILEL